MGAVRDYMGREIATVHCYVEDGEIRVKVRVKRKGNEKRIARKILKHIADAYADYMEEGVGISVEAPQGVLEEFEREWKSNRKVKNSEAGIAFAAGLYAGSLAAKMMAEIVGDAAERTLNVSKFLITTAPQEAYASLSNLYAVFSFSSALIASYALSNFSKRIKGFKKRLSTSAFSLGLGAYGLLKGIKYLAEAYAKSRSLSKFHSYMGQRYRIGELLLEYGNAMKNFADYFLLSPLLALGLGTLVAHLQGKEAQKELLQELRKRVRYVKYVRSD